MELEEIKQRMKNEQLYLCDDPALMKEQMVYLDNVFLYNSLKPSQQAEKQALLKKMFAQMGEDCYIETPFHASFGGTNTHLGNHVYANFNLTLIDDCDIYLGNDVLIGPNVVISTGTHPIAPSIRKKQAQYNMSVHIEDNVWLGANSVVLPGVTIGKNSVIGAGSIVTKDIPANVVAVGSPCKVLRNIKEDDEVYFHKDRIIDIT